MLALGLAAGPAAKAASLQQVSNWTGGVANLPSDVLMYVYVPDKVAVNPPVLALIHSCASDAQTVLGQAGGLKAAADKSGFIIVVPQSNASSKRCWTTDSTQAWTRNTGGDSNAIKQMVVYALSKYQANADRVYVAGCSSGAMMTELQLALYPEIYKAGASFAGMPAGCHGPNDNSSNATGYNGTCAGGKVNYTPQQWGSLVSAMDPGYTGHRPRLQLFHGSADMTISYLNMSYSESQYINLLNLSTNPTKMNTGLTLGTHQASEQQWTNSCGYVVLDAFDSIGGDHGPSDALFDATYVVPFLALDQIGAVDPEITKCGAGAGGAGGAGGSAGGAAGGSAGSGGRAGGSSSGASGNGGSSATGGTGGGSSSAGGVAGSAITGTAGNIGSGAGAGNSGGFASGIGGSTGVAAGAPGTVGGSGSSTPPSDLGGAATTPGDSSSSGCSYTSVGGRVPRTGAAASLLAMLAVSLRRRRRRSSVR